MNVAGAPQQHSGPPLANPQPQGQQPQPADGTIEAGGEASAEEQEVYDQIVQSAINMIYPESGENKVSPGILQNLNGQFDPRVEQMFQGAQPPLQQNPVDNLAVTGVMVTVMVQAQLENMGQKVDQEILLYAGAEILEILLELAEAAKIVEMSVEDLEDATLRAADLYRVGAPGADIASLASQFEKIVEADRAET